MIDGEFTMRGYGRGTGLVQSSGGKATRQKAGFGALNSTPTSRIPSAAGLLMTTVQESDSAVRIFFMVRV